MVVWCCIYLCFFFFFFFKQKTAYEMRISDWSSDVCSSDLLMPTDDSVCYVLPNFAPGLRTWIVRMCATLLQRRSKERHQIHRQSSSCYRDRKSVVWGKSVSVRVDLGGRRIIKKTKNIHRICDTEIIHTTDNIPTQIH